MNYYGFLDGSSQRLGPLITMPTIIWILIALTCALFGLKMAYVVSTASVLPMTRGATFVSTSRARIDAFLDALPMQEGQLLVDIGCGDGRVLRRARARYRADAVGYELNPFAYLKARLMCPGRRGVRVRWGNFFNADLSGYDVVFCYLFPDVMGDLEEKLRAELRPGATVASCNFPLPGSMPYRVLRPGGSLNNDPIYLYRMGKNGLFGKMETDE